MKKNNFALLTVSAAVLFALLVFAWHRMHPSQSTLSVSPTAVTPRITWVLQGQANAEAESAWASEHRKLGELVAESTNGELAINYQSGVVPDTEVLTAVQTRKLNLGFMGTHYMPEAVAMNLQLLPIVPNDRLPEILAVLKPRFGEIWEKQYGVKLLAFSYYLPQLLFTSNSADSLDAMRGQRIRLFSPDSIRLYGHAGVVPVELKHVTEVLPNLIQGKLDGTQGALPAYVNWGWAERLKYISNWPVGSTYMALVANMDDWNSLTPELQDKLMRAAEQLEKNQWAGRQAYVDGLIKEAQTRFDAKVANPSQAEVDKLLATIQPILDAWKSRAGPDAVPVLAAINQVLGTHYQ